MKKMMALWICLSTSLVMAGQESGGTQGIIFIVQPATRMAIRETLLNHGGKSRRIAKELEIHSGSPEKNIVDSIGRTGLLFDGSVYIEIEF